MLYVKDLILIFQKELNIMLYLDCELLREVYINLLDAKEPKFNLSTKDLEQNLVRNKNYNKKVLKISE